MVKIETTVGVFEGLGPKAGFRLKGKCGGTNGMGKGPNSAGGGGQGCGRSGVVARGEKKGPRSLAEIEKRKGRLKRGVLAPTVREVIRQPGGERGFTQNASTTTWAGGGKVQCLKRAGLGVPTPGGKRPNLKRSSEAGDVKKGGPLRLKGSNMTSSLKKPTWG